MTTPIRMDEDQSHMTARMLDITLEIICLLTGEGHKSVMKLFEYVKSSGYDHVSEGQEVTSRHNTGFPSISQTLKRGNGEKILKFTNKITELLTGEVPIRCQDVSVYFSMEEWEYLEGHKDLYKDIVMMGAHPIFTYENNTFCLNEMILNLTLEIIYLLTAEDSVGVKRENSNISLLPLLDIEKHDKHKVLKCINQITELLTEKVPIRCQDVSVYFSMEEWAYLEGHKDLYKDIVMMEDQPPLISPGGQHLLNTLDGCLLSEVNFEYDGTPIYFPDVNTFPSKHYRLYGLLESKDPEKSSWNPDINSRSPSADKSVHSSKPIKSEGHEEVHIDKNFSCLRHEKSLKNQSDCLIHRTRCNKVSDFGNSFSNNSEHLHQNIKKHENPFSCSECGKCFILKKKLLKHQQVHKVERSYLCSECGNCFPKKRHLLKHQRTHMGECPCICSACGKGFPDKRSLLKHQRTHTSERPYICSVCGKGFHAKIGLLKHQTIHTGERPYSCAECGKCFPDKGNLCAHQKSHAGIRPYSCSECGKCFAAKSKLLIHHRTHTGERPFSCSECDKCFYRSTELLRHQRIHTGESPFTCPECGKCFNVKGNLLIHQRIHTGERPFSCAECGQCFGRKANLLRHQKSHTGESPFSCSECGQRFTRKLNLQRHQKKHIDIRSFSCAECGKSYLRKNNLTKHQRTHSC